MEGDDLIAIEAKYHLQCLTELRNRYWSLIQKFKRFWRLFEEKMIKARVFIELFTYIENCIEDATFYFISLSDV